MKRQKYPRDPDLTVPCKYYFNYPYSCQRGLRCKFSHIIFNPNLFLPSCTPEYNTSFQHQTSFPFHLLPLEVLDIILCDLSRTDRLNLRGITTWLLDLIDKSTLWNEEFPFLQCPLILDNFGSFLYYRKVYWGYRPLSVHLLYFPLSIFVSPEIKTSKGLWKFTDVPNPYFILNLLYQGSIFCSEKPLDLGFVVLRKRTNSSFYENENWRAYVDELYSDLCLKTELTGGSLPGRIWEFYSAFDHNGEKIYYASVYRHRDESWCDKTNVDKATLIKLIKVSPVEETV